MPGVPLSTVYKPSSKDALCKLGLFTDNIMHFESPSFICFNQPSYYQDHASFWSISPVIMWPYPKPGAIFRLW